MKVLLVAWHDAAWHPVTIFTAQLLTEQGANVHFLYRHAEYFEFGPVNYGTGTMLYPITLKHSRIGQLGLLMRSAQLARRLRPDVIIGYDMYGALAAYVAQRVRPSAKLIYHNLDIAGDESLSIYARFVKSREHLALRAADQVLVSSPGRAAYLKQEARLARDPLVVLNCQRSKIIEPTTSELRGLLEKQGLRFDRLVVRLGSLGPGHSIEATIRSVLNWRGNWGLLLAGFGKADYLIELHHMIEMLKLEQQVLLLPSVPYTLWYDCLYSADLGIALYEPGNINHASMAGAGNKLNLYLKAGIPSVLPDFPDFVAFLDKYPAGQAVRPDDPAAIAAAINAILEDERKYAQMSRQARLAFQNEFNFEVQYQPVLDWLTTHA